MRIIIDIQEVLSLNRIYGINVLPKQSLKVPLATSGLFKSSRFVAERCLMYHNQNGEGNPGAKEGFPLFKLIPDIARSRVAEIQLHLAGKCHDSRSGSDPSFPASGKSLPRGGMSNPLCSSPRRRQGLHSKIILSF